MTSSPSSTLEDAEVPLQYQSETMRRDQHHAMSRRAVVDRSRDRYPFSIVWGPLPLISWLLPFVGHLGICDSEGRVHDFAGPYCVNTDRFMVPVTRILPIDLSSLSSSSSSSSSSSPPSSSSDSSLTMKWDESIGKADAHFSDTMHNIVCNNCHHHCSMALTEMGLKDKYGNQVKCAWQMLTRGKWKSSGAVIQTFGPFLLIVSIIIIAVMLTR